MSLQLYLPTIVVLNKDLSANRDLFRLRLATLTLHGALPIDRVFGEDLSMAMSHIFPKPIVQARRPERWFRPAVLNTPASTRDDRR